MAIGRLQKSTGDELYLWAQDCLTKSDAQLKADQRFPRTDREVTAKLLKTCRKGKFGLLFQGMVEHERSVTGGMPNGRIMMASIFRHFLNLKLAGQSVADLEAFRDKYQYVLSAIPIDELPKERTLFNHLVDELAKCTAMKSKVDKAIEASGSSHRRSTSWLWAKVRNAIDLDQQKGNRDGFEKNLKLKPTVLTSTTSQKDDVPANPAETARRPGRKKRSRQQRAPRPRRLPLLASHQEGRHPRRNPRASKGVISLPALMP